MKETIREIDSKDAAHGLDCDYCKKPATHIITSDNCPTCGSEIKVCKDHLLDIAAKALAALGLQAYFDFEGHD